MYRKLHRVASLSITSSSDLDIAVADLLTLAFFFCMWSCKYAGVQGDRQTKILCIRYLRFFDRNNKDIPQDITNLHLAVTLSITFEFQKKKVRNDTISQQRSFDTIAGGEMCPVLAAAKIVKQIHSYNIPADKFRDTPINIVKSGLTYNSLLPKSP